MNTLELPILESLEDPPPLPPGHTPYSRTHSRKHGYVPELALARHESDRFYSFEQCLYDEYRPTCATESLLLDEVTLNYWRLQRARALEADALTGDRENEKLIALYYRYRVSFERSFFRALRLLRKVKAENTRFIAQYSAQSAAFGVLRKSASFVSQNRSIDDPADQDDLLPILDDAA